jgi:hypothetical protein
MRNDGRKAEVFFEQYWDTRPGADCERVTDSKALRGLNGGRAVGDFPKPSDYLVCDNGLLHYAEVKSTDKTTRFAFCDVRPAQKAKALTMAKIGGPYFFYIYSFGLGKWFVMSAKTFAEAVGQDRKSITFEELPTWDF